MKLEIKKYNDQINEWPQKGFHIMAQYNEDEIIVYQSYKKTIGDFVSKNQYFGGDFSLNRMTWIKPNFLWMMYRNGWGTKDGQEVVLAIHLKMEAFKKYLINGIYSTYNHTHELSQEEWQKQIAVSDVRLQWDPDHCPKGNKLERKAIQIGLRNEFIKSFANKDIVLVKDISQFVKEQYEFVKNNEYDKLYVPYEKPLVFEDENLNKKLKIV